MGSFGGYGSPPTPPDVRQAQRRLAKVWYAWYRKQGLGHLKAEHHADRKGKLGKLPK